MEWTSASSKKSKISNQTFRNVKTAFASAVYNDRKKHKLLQKLFLCPAEKKTHTFDVKSCNGA